MPSTAHGQFMRPLHLLQRLGLGNGKRVSLDIEWDGDVGFEVHRIIWDDRDAAKIRDSTNSSNLGFYLDLATMTSDCC